VALQLISYLEDNHLYEPLQSGYKKSHSTETKLIKVHNDIVTAIDSGHSVILILLDLSAAFDTVDHRILIRGYVLVLGFVIERSTGLSCICPTTRNM